MVSKGVRINDFGIVIRANRYYSADTVGLDDRNDGAFHVDAPTAGIKWTSNVTTAKDLAKSGTVSPNHSHIEQMLLWIVMCSSFGVLSYVLFDQWTSVALGRRILYKYIFKPKAE